MVNDTSTKGDDSIVHSLKMLGSTAEDDDDDDDDDEDDDDKDSGGSNGREACRDECR